MNLERAIEIAAVAHNGQINKAGEPYILHALRVMFRVAEDDARIVAVLHDVVVRCAGWSFERLTKEGFSSTIVQALEALSQRQDEKDDYLAFIKRAGENPIGRRVKIADLTDTLAMFSMPRPSLADYRQIEKYEKALAYLEGIEHWSSGTA